ncbi:MAG: fluoride efflux transporter CrcB [Desulfovibrio sp.]|nr:MAG: fluoride efflux transporter CrcB [Desulfovibrio sp.]
MAYKLFFLALAGGLGSLCRYGLSGLAQRLAGTSFPLGTFVVNAVGSFLFGLIWGALEERVGLNPEIRVIVLTGFMGAFTTFSTFAFETMSLIQHSQWWAVFANLAGQIVVGLALVFLGMALGRAI